MPSIRMTRSGLNIAGASRRRGEVLDVDVDVADYLCSGGHAVRATDEDVRLAVAQDEVRTAAQRATARPGRRIPRERA